MSINIAGLTPVDDPSYRYKMPPIIGKVEGRGNGIKTVLVNVVELAASLNRSAPEVTKFFGCELGSQTTFAADNRFIVNGAHRNSDLQSHLNKYIENFVLCKKCKLPETEYKVKDGIVSQKCMACGSKEMVDMTHKLTTFILAQHKKNKETSKGKKDKDTTKAAESTEKVKGDKKKTGEKKSKEDKIKVTSASNDQQDDDDDDFDTGVNESSTTAPSTETVFKLNSLIQAVSTDATETVKESVAETGAGLTMDQDDSDQKAAEEAIGRFKVWHVQHVTATPSDIIEKLRELQTLASLRASDRIIIYLGSTFTEMVIKKNEISQHKVVLKAFAPSLIQQRHLIAAFEWLFGTYYHSLPNGSTSSGVDPSSLMRLFPVALKQLYDEEIVSEEVFIEWSKDNVRNEFSAEQSMISYETLEQLRALAAPFIKWLEEAEEEDEEGEDEEEEEEEEEEGTDG